MYHVGINLDQGNAIFKLSKQYSYVDTYIFLNLLHPPKNVFILVDVIFIVIHNCIDRLKNVKIIFK